MSNSQFINLVTCLEQLKNKSWQLGHFETSWKLSKQIAKIGKIANNKGALRAWSLKTKRLISNI